MNSVWTDTCKLPEFQPLKKNLRTGVLVIGGGIAGILCGYMLKEAGVDYAVVESGRICSGITANTTGKITSQHGLIYDTLVDKYGLEKARMYLKANEDAILKYKDLCKSIPCDLEEKDAFVYSLYNKNLIYNEIKALDLMGYPVEFVDKTELPFSVVGALKFRDQAQFNPLKFISEITKGMNIYEKTKVNVIEDMTAITNGYKITADKIIVATHFPFINTRGAYFMKMHQRRSYVIGFENAQDVKGMYIDESNIGFSFRNYKNLLLIGGGAHRTGKPGGKWEEIENFAKEYYPNSIEKYRWATQDCMTLDSIPYIGNYSKSTPNLYVITGFNKWGMTTAMTGAMILRDAVLGKDNEYREVFEPSRSMINPQLFINGFETTVNLLNLSKKRCSHLGCALKWNKEEHTWDCTCHGSRFDEDGKLIDNPAMTDISN